MEDTTQWLINHMATTDFELHMRSHKDNRKDDIIKYEILVNNILPKYYPIGWIDDRNQVTDMVRKVGLTCFQCDYGDF
jgi:hypothetical protein